MFPDKNHPIIGVPPTIMNPKKSGSRWISRVMFCAMLRASLINDSRAVWEVTQLRMLPPQLCLLVTIRYSWVFINHPLMVSIAHVAKSIRNHSRDWQKCQGKIWKKWFIRGLGLSLFRKSKNCGWSTDVHWYYPLVNVYIKRWKDPPFSMGKSTISMVIFNSKL